VLKSPIVGSDSSQLALNGLDKTRAFKVIAGHPKLSGAIKSVGAFLVDHFNIKTKRCDPGLERLAAEAGFTKRTVCRAIRSLERAGLLKSFRHGGHYLTNSYDINWTVIRVLNDQFERRKLKWWRCTREDNLVTPEGTIQSQTSDKNVHQNLEGNPESKPLKKEDKGNSMTDEGIPRTESLISQLRRNHPSSREVASRQAEKRWNEELMAIYGKDYLAYGRFIELITPDDNAAATAAELNCRGDGLRLLQQRIAQLSFTDH